MDRRVVWLAEHGEDLLRRCGELSGSHQVHRTILNEQSRQAKTGDVFGWRLQMGSFPIDEMDSVWRRASSRDFGRMEAAMNIRFSALFDHGSRRNMASTSAARAKIPEKPVDQEFDRCSRSDRAALGTMR